MRFPRLPRLAAALLLSLAVHAVAAPAVNYAALTTPPRRILADTDTFHDIESYKINTRRLIEFKADAAKGTLTITNWIPRHLENLKVVRRSGGKQTELLTLDRLPGLETVTLPVAAAELAGDPEFDFVPQDDAQREIKKITVEWELTFGDRYMHSPTYRDANVQWRPVHPQDARYLLTFIIHAAQAVSHPRFEQLWMKTPFSFSEKETDKKAVPAEYRLTEAELATYPADERKLYDPETLRLGRYYNKAHRKMVFEKYRNKRMNLGVTGGGGLGGGSAIGINHSKFIPLAWSHSDAAAKVFDDGGVALPDDAPGEMHKTPWIIYGHECGHALGFGHNSTYCIASKYSHITVGTIVQSWITREKKNLVNSDIMVGRDEKWEGHYVKFGPGSKLTRPLISTAFEWAGPYGRHSFVFPRKGKPEWNEYLAQIKKGKGFEYIKQLPMNVMIAKLESRMSAADFKNFQHAWANDQGMEFLQAFEQGTPFTLKKTGNDEDPEEADDKGEDAPADTKPKKAGKAKKGGK